MTLSTVLKHIGLLCLVGAACLAGGSAAGDDGRDKRLQMIEVVPVQTIPYELARDIEFSLEPGQGVRLDLSDNPYRLMQCYVLRFPREDVIETTVMDRLGNVFNLGGTGIGEADSATGFLRQVGRLPYYAYATWRMEGDKAVVTFRIETDPFENQKLYDKWADAPRGTMSIRTKNWNGMRGSDLSETQRVAGFVRLWSEVKYNFAFFDQVPEVDWESMLDEYLPRVRDAESTVEYYRLLQKCLAKLNDGHTSVWGPSVEPVGTLPFMVEGFDGRAIITQLYSTDWIMDRELAEQIQKANLQVGEEVTHLDGRAVQAILQKDLYPYLSASTPQAKDYRAYPKLLRGEPTDKPVAVTVRSRDGVERVVHLQRASYLFETEKQGFVFRELGDGVVYVNLPDFGSRKVVDEFEKVWPQVKQAKGLILDVRENGGGSSSTGYAIISYLIDKPIWGSKWKTRQYMPSYKAWGYEEKWYEADAREIKPRGGESFGGPVVVLVGVGTNSAAEDFVVAMHASGRGKIVGGRTRGSTGQPLVLELPGGGGARICTKRDTYPDGREFVGVGIIPDVEVSPTPEDIAAGRDVVLQRGIDVVKVAIADNSK